MKRNVRLSESYLNRVIKESIRTVLSEGKEYNIRREVLNFVLKNRPKYCDWAVIDMNNLSTYPRYFETRNGAADFVHFLKMDYRCKPVMLNLSSYLQ